MRLKYLALFTCDIKGPNVSYTQALSNGRPTLVKELNLCHPGSTCICLITIISCFYISFFSNLLLSFESKIIPIDCFILFPVFGILFTTFSSQHENGRRATKFETPTLIQGQLFLCELTCLICSKKKFNLLSGSYYFYFHVWKRESEWLAKNKNRNIIVCVWIFKLNYYIPCLDLYAFSKLNFTRLFWESNEMNSEIETLALNHMGHAVDKEQLLETVTYTTNSWEVTFKEKKKASKDCFFRYCTDIFYCMPVGIF